MSAISNDWLEPLSPEFKKPYYAKLYKTVKEEYSTHQIFPPADDIFNAFAFTPLKDVKVVILGQDPYHGNGQAHGLCFSVKPDVEIPPSLVNIFKEIKSDLGIDNMGKHGELTEWAKNGVLLLNSVLTVRANQARSHRNLGWEEFTDNVIRLINLREKPVVFMLWGADAKAKAKLITNPNHLILKAAHPSPLSAFNGFFGCRHFSKANEFLKSKGIEEIDWSI